MPLFPAKDPAIASEETGSRELSKLLKEPEFKIAFKKNTNQYIFIFDFKNIRDAYIRVFNKLVINYSEKDITINDITKYNEIAKYNETANEVYTSGKTPVRMKYLLFIDVNKIEYIKDLLLKYATHNSVDFNSFFKYFEKLKLAKERLSSLNTLVNLLAVPNFTIQVNYSKKGLSTTLLKLSHTSKITDYIFIFNDTKVMNNFKNIFDKLEIIYAVKVPKQIVILPNQMDEIHDMTFQYIHKLDYFKRQLYDGILPVKLDSNDERYKEDKEKADKRYREDKEKEQEELEKEYKLSTYICIPNLNGEFSSQIECKEKAMNNLFTNDWDRKYLKYKMKYLNLKLNK